MRTLLLIPILLLMPGCQSFFGPNSLSNTHPAYNQAIVNSLSQQMLLNLVRLKYRDTPYYLKISSITSALTLSGSAGIDASIDLRAGGNILKPSLGIGYTDRPTISYSPLQGEDFLKNILSSVSLEALLVMSQSGWSIERVFGLFVERINKLYNAPEASGPTPSHAPHYQAFKRMLSLFRELQLKGNIEIGLSQTDVNNTAELVLLINHQSASLQEARELIELLNINYTEKVAGNHHIRISNNFLEQHSNQLTIRTRSIASVLFYLSQNIDIPQQHVDAGLITLTKNQDHSVFDWDLTPAGSLFKIHSSDTYPNNAYLTIPYRDYWFYIADNDLQSKSTFMLLTQIFDLQAGQSKYSGPALTLPVR